MPNQNKNTFFLELLSFAQFEWARKMNILEKKDGLVFLIAYLTSKSERKPQTMIYIEICQFLYFIFC